MNTEEFFTAHQACQYQYPEFPSHLSTDEQRASWILFESGIPYLALDIDGPWQTMYQEALSLDSEFVAHRGDGAGWSSLCVHGTAAKETMSYNAYPQYANLPDQSVPYRWTEIQDLCPVTVDYFKNYFPFTTYTRLRYMKLAAGGSIPPHNDGTGTKMVAINIALNNPAGCEMVIEHVGIVPFKSTGGAVAFNNCHNHAVRNLSPVHRYHMIVHGMWSPVYEQAVVRSYKKSLEFK
jgi:Aspartyl/Asparaginyl beta-hydroxylase